MATGIIIGHSVTGIIDLTALLEYFDVTALSILIFYVMHNC